MAFGFWADSAPDNTTLKTANKKTYQSLSDLQTAFPDTAVSVCQSDGEFISVSKVCDLVSKILDNAVSKQVGNTACFLSYLFNFASAS